MEDFLLEAGIDGGKNIMKEVRLEAGSVACFSCKAPTSGRAESPSTVQEHPLCLPGGCRACRGLKQRNLCTSGKKRVVQEHFKRQIHGGDLILTLQWPALGVCEGQTQLSLRRSNVLKATDTEYTLARLSSLQVNLISMPDIVLKSFYFKCMWRLWHWLSPVCSCQPAQVSPCHWGFHWFHSTVLSFLSFCLGVVVLLCEHV